MDKNGDIMSKIRDRIHTLIEKIESSPYSKTRRRIRITLVSIIITIFVMLWMMTLYVKFTEEITSEQNTITIEERITTLEQEVAKLKGE